MMYQSYQNLNYLVEPLRWLAKEKNQLLERMFDGAIPKSLVPYTAMNEQIGLMGFTHVRGSFEIESVMDAKGQIQKVQEVVFTQTAFCKLMHFKKEQAEGEPKILLVAPMSGHFATLLRGTLKTLLKDHEVFITDWENVRDIPKDLGNFDFDSYVKHIIQFLEAIGENTHLMAVCQPTVPALIATAILSEDHSPVTPASLILLAGPIDVRHNPTNVNQLAKDKPIEWFKEKLISPVPIQCAGAGRRVYPGIVQLCAFLSMNQQRHKDAFKKLYAYRKSGDQIAAQAIANFYEEYFAVMDLSADFYIETVEKIFQKVELAQGLMTYQGRAVNLRAIKKPFLLTIEGERDDICGLGQTLAAQDLCALLPAYRKTHYLQAGVGHYGVFNGKRWENQIYPIVRTHIQSTI